MELESMENDPNSMKEKRGTFLLVLCILSWVSSGFSVISSLTTLVGGKKGIQDQILEMEDQLDSADSEFLYSILENALIQLNATLENFFPLQLCLLVISAVGVFSVFLMYNLKKNGFGLYVLYAILSPLITYYFFRNIPESTTTLMFSLSISAVFITMYYTNLKRMTN